MGLVPGALVQTVGLDAAPHFNGLTGTIMSGPNEQGRFSVALVISADGIHKEHQTKALKPSNLKVVNQEAWQSPATTAVAAAGATTGANANSASLRAAAAAGFPSAPSMPPNPGQAGGSYRARRAAAGID